MPVPSDNVLPDGMSSLVESMLSWALFAAESVSLMGLMPVPPVEPVLALVAGISLSPATGIGWSYVGRVEAEGKADVAAAADWAPTGFELCPTAAVCAPTTVYEMC